MASVGAFLRELRARRGVSLEEIARKTRVAPRYLEALEADAYADLPAPVFIRGFIRAYCQALGESPEEALACYDGRDGRVPSPAARPAPLARGTGAEPRTRGAIIVSFVLLVVLGMALFTVALVIRPRERASTAPPPATTPVVSAPAAPAAEPPPAASVAPSTPAPSATTLPAPSVALRPATPAPPAAATAPATATPAPVAAAPGPGPGAPAGSVSAPYRLVARVSDTSWIRVRTEDGRTIEETLPAGEVREWVSDRPFVLTIGNAGGVALELNGRALPPLGPRGVVIPRLVLPSDPR